MSDVGVEEIHPEDVQRVDVLRHGTVLMLILNGRPYRAEEGIASSLAWDLCKQLDAIRDIREQVSTIDPSTSDIV